jgi:uncharacterized lipoprotein YmbA
MPRLKMSFMIACAALLLTACQTTKRLAASQPAICLALSKSDTLPVLTKEEKALLLQHFSREVLDRLKTPQAIMRQIGC